MDYKYIKNKIKEIFEQHGIMMANFEEIKVDSSIVFISILCCIEEEFDIYIPENMISLNLLQNFEELINYIYDEKNKTNE